MAVAGAGARAQAASHGSRAAAAGVISTVAGGVGGPAKATHVGVEACAVAFGAGSLYIGDSAAMVRKVSPGTDELTTPAGTGSTEPLGDRGPAMKAGLFLACGVAVDGAGNLVIADDGHNRVRVVAAASGTFYGQAMTSRHIYTVAGDGTSGFSGDGGPATAAALNNPADIAVDGAGNLVIADTGNERVRVAAVKTGTFYGQAMTAGDIYTVAGDGTSGFSGDGGPATSAELNRPDGVTVDGAGNLVIADEFNQRIRVVAVKTGSFYGQAMTAGDIYTVAGDGTRGFSGDGGRATSAELNGPDAVALDGAGNLVIADNGNNRVRVVAAKTGSFYGQAMTAGDIYTVAGTGTKGFSGDGGPATQAKMRSPDGVALDAAGNLVIADSRNFRVRVVAAATGGFYGQAMTTGDIYTVAGKNGPVFSGDTGLATRAQLDGPTAVALDGAGNLMIAGELNNRVRMVAATTGTFFGQAMTAGHIYTVAGTGVGNFSGDGGLATRSPLDSPQAVAMDGAGNLLIADTFNFRIRVVAATTGSFYGQAMTTGHIYTIAGGGTGGLGDGGPATSAKLAFPDGVALDGTGNVVIADEFNQRIRVVAVKTGTFYGQAMTAGDIYTVAGDGIQGFSGDGGPATSAELNRPEGVAVDGAGNVVIADSWGDRIRVVAVKTGTFYGLAMTAGDIYTVAGNGRRGFSGDGGPATSAEFNAPDGVAVDGAGNLVIPDLNNNRIRVVAASSGTFYGLAMTAGDIYTVAGNGRRGFSGDGGPATKAEMGLRNGINYTLGVAVDAAGNLVIPDNGNNRIRTVAG